MLGLFALNVFNSSNKTGVDSLLDIISIYTRLNWIWSCFKAVLPFNSTQKRPLWLKMAGGGRYTDGSNAIRKMSKVGRNGYGMRCGKTDGGMNPLNSSSPSISIPQWFIFIPQIICNRCHAQRAHRRNNVIFLMDFQDEYESDGMDTTEALLFFLHECFMVI